MQILKLHYICCCCRALQLGLLTQDMIDMYDPALMFTIPRLAIVRCATVQHSVVISKFLLRTSE